MNGIYFPIEARQFTDPESVIPSLPIMEARCDDVLVCGCLRSGTNWLWEIVNMLIKGKAEYEKGRKIPTVIEHAKQEHLGEMTSPRVLSTHMKFKYIPKDFIQKKCKIVYIQRNPKDVAVSFYKYRNSEFESMNISWEDYLYIYV
ncbi:hypothetical protein KUTeg_023772 [Tegillarca granosa]|uniref:Sulfotransferase domain-containing protein n=1 Tax=Tegillarca granosa TaxID=220873 RepID=A0ABQ9E827_TEGGR|nr:hypothetical protein KUTeg_023772 [Tegillarca granosa]